VTDTVRTGKWIGGLHGDTPCVVAARRVLRRRLRAVDELVEFAARRADEDPEHVHQLRVAARRSVAALQAFRAFCRPRMYKRLRRYLRQVRRDAGAARQYDVQRGLLADEIARLAEPQKPAAERLISQLTAERWGAQESVIKLADEHQGLGRRSRVRRLLKSRITPREPTAKDAADQPSMTPYTLAALATTELPDLLEAVRQKRGLDLHEPTELHSLRIAGKKLRYALEIFAGCFPARLKDELYPRLVEMLEDLGKLNDWSEIAAYAEREAQSATRPAEATDHVGGNGRAAGIGIGELGRLFQERYRQLHREFLDWWESKTAFELLEQLHEIIQGRAVAGPSVSREPAHAIRPTADAPRWADAAVAETPSVGDVAHTHRRVAAVDVGTNSIRLVVGETDPLTKFRVIEDIKETTRLGGGVFADGCMTDESMEASIRAIERMKDIAVGCRVDRVRAVATSAVREAGNRDEFLDRVERRTGVRLEVIDAEHEARLAFSSVVNTFELDDRRVAITDIGGGSTELVLSSGGVIDQVFPLPLGAVRLTERFGGPDGRERFDEMRRTIDKVVHERLSATTYQPYLIIGTGGTFTSLARVAIRHGTAGGGGGRLPFAVRGYELRHGEVMYFLEFLRRMPLEERRKVAGLSSQRADIIVAGVCIVERLMQRFGVDRVRVHDGGIRDGLLAEMIDELGFRSAPPRRRPHSSIDEARKFAERSRYERSHSEHVARLALRMFDQITERNPDAVGAWGREEARHLLHAAGLLHDVGIAVEYRRHHQHSYDMVIHADLAGYSRREIEIIANICRYHRRRGPRAKHEAFRRLGDDDQRLVTHLAGILRIADGLDRLHLQDVLDVVVTPGPKGTVFDAVAYVEPTAGLRCARRKANVFEKAFRTRARFVWTSASDVTPRPAPTWALEEVGTGI